MKRRNHYSRIQVGFKIKSDPDSPGSRSHALSAGHIVDAVAEPVSVAPDVSTERTRSTRLRWGERLGCNHSGSQSDSMCSVGICWRRWPNDKSIAGEDVKLIIIKQVKEPNVGRHELTKRVAHGTVDPNLTNDGELVTIWPG